MRRYGAVCRHQSVDVCASRAHARGLLFVIDPESGKTARDFNEYQGFSEQRRDGNRRRSLCRFAGGNPMALDAKTGKLLWCHQTGRSIAASPMSFVVDCRQYVAIASEEWRSMCARDL